jgi:hypothetical protein
MLIGYTVSEIQVAESFVPKKMLLTIQKAAKKSDGQAWT